MGIIKYTIANVRQCFFCDSKVCHIVTAHPATKDGVPKEHQNEYFQIMCDNCGACGPVKSSEQDAAEAWGTGRDDCQGSDHVLEDQDNKFIDIRFLDDIKNHIIAGKNDFALKMINTWINELEQEYEALKTETK